MASVVVLRFQIASQNARDIPPISQLVLLYPNQRASVLCWNKTGSRWLAQYCIISGRLTKN